MFDVTENSRLIIEGLRSGVPYRDMAKNVAFGRERYIEHVRRLMEGVEQERPPKFPAHIVRANYGEGKTHLLHSLWGLAEDRNWVVSFVSFSKETPLNRLDQLYPKIIENTYMPGSSHPGVAGIVERALESQLLAEALALKFSPRVMAVLNSLVVRDEGYEELRMDIAGQFLGVAELKRIHRQNLGRPPSLPRASLKDEAFEYIRFVDWLIHKAGFQGWLILADEVELIGKLGRGARSQAYANMGRFLAGDLPHTLTVWALAANFLGDVLIRRNDREEAPRWLAVRPREEARAPWCETALDALLESKLLDSLALPQVQSLIVRIHDWYQSAYNWAAPFDGEELYRQTRHFAPTQDTRLRTWVRLSLTILDIWYQYGEAPVIRHVDPLGDPALDEAPDGGTGDSTGGGAGDGAGDGERGPPPEAEDAPMITRRTLI